jgi:hypothetical protein
MGLAVSLGARGVASAQELHTAGDQRRKPGDRECCNAPLNTDCLSFSGLLRRELEAATAALQQLGSEFEAVGMCAHNSGQSFKLIIRGILFPFFFF